MLRPKQMSKVSVTGSKRVMDRVVEAVHGMNLLHLTDYDGSWQGFSPGDPAEGAEEASDQLVTVRSIESILDIDEDDAGPTRVLDDEELETELERIRTEVNELDDQRDEVRSELRGIDERIDAVEPFARLDIDLDLLQGYDSLQVAVGEGDPEAVERAVIDAEHVDEFELFENEGVVAVFARPSGEADEDALSDALVGAEFAALEVPDAEGSPAAYVEELEHRKQQLESRLDTIEDEIHELKLDAAGFLLAAEEALSIEVQKREAPLSFATTENAFVAEGWIPSERYTGFASTLTDATDGRVEVEELEQAQFSHSGTHHTEEVEPGAEAGAAREARADGGRARSDGGNVVMRQDSPPVVQDNPDVVRPFEILVKAVSRPKYSEFDPTVILFLTFPAFFGLMIGDLGYGTIYTLLGYYLYTNFDSDAFRSMGGVTVAAGLFTMLFGVLYGEIFGLHLVGDYLWGGHPPLHKGLQPADLKWAKTWLVVSAIVGVLHLDVGYVIDFVENLEHDLKHAVYESGSWLLMMNGLWVWVFSTSLEQVKPDFLYTVFNTGEAASFALGFGGFPASVGLVGAAAFFLGLVLLVVGEPVEAVEFLQVLVNVLSYARVAAVLLAKAGMAFVVNLLFFGVYVTGEGEHAEWHFALDHLPEVGSSAHGHEVTAIMFPGLVHSGVVAVLVGLLVLVLGHILVLALGVTSAGLQAVRLEYVEFFGKFYEGGGREYEPFGRERRYTAED